MGGAVPPAVERAAHMGDAWLASFTTDPDVMRGLFDTYRAALPPGKEPEMPICRECFIGASNADALDKCRETLIDKYAAYASWDNNHVAAARPCARWGRVVGLAFGTRLSTLVRPRRRGLAGGGGG